jgi:uncharacterized protein with WD repeat
MLASVERSTKKSTQSTLEVFHIREKGIPIDTMDIGDSHIVALSWEPMGNKFAVITTNDELALASKGPIRTKLAIYSVEKRADAVGSIQLSSKCILYDRNH